MHRLVLRDQCRSALKRGVQRHSARRCYGGQQRPNTTSPEKLEFCEAGFGKLFVLLSPFIAVGGVVTYAKYDADFRKQLETNVPGAEAFIKAALSDKPTLAEVRNLLDEKVNSVKTQIDSVSKTIDSVSSTVTGLFGGSNEKQQAKEEPAKLEKPAKNVSQQQSQKTELSKAEPKPTAAAAPAAKPKPEPLPNNITDLEKSIELSASLAVKEYQKAIETLKSFNEDVRRIVDQSVESGDKRFWTTLRNKTNARDTSVETAEQHARDALSKIERCEIALSKIVNAENSKHVEELRGKIKRLVEHVNSAKDDLYKNKDLASVSEKYWRNVEKARNYYIEQLEALFPGVNLSAKRLNLTSDELDLFIAHAFTHVLTHQKELERLQTDGELRLKRAIDAIRGGTDDVALKEQVSYHLESAKAQLALDNQKRILKIQADAEQLLRNQLKKQAEAHADHIKDVVGQRESELKRSFNQELEDKLETEKASYKLQLAAMLGKLRGMDAALQEIDEQLKARAETERAAHQSQALWAACQALWASVRTVVPGKHYKEKLRPLSNEISAIAKAAEGDELVHTVISSLPKEARERGIFPEEALRERFVNVERVARKVAMVPEEGASLPMYLLSYLQSIFILTPDNPVSQDELEDKPFDFSKLDTYDVLNRARYYVDRGNFLQAVKYMNLLKGAPRKAASDWVHEVQLMLETQQAANLLMAHAAASGLLYL